MTNANESMENLSEALASAIEKAAPSVVQVASRDPRGRGHASGTVWSADVVLTAAHVVMRSDETRIRLDDGTERRATVAGRNLVPTSPC